MSDCNYTSIIYEQECIGDSLVKINNNFNNLNGAVCDLESNLSTLSANITAFITDTISGNIINYTHTNFLPLTGGIISGEVKINSNLTVNGNISGNNLKISFNQGSATGNYSFAIGSGIASGTNSHAEGFNTVASGFYSHAEGNQTRALNAQTHAEGYNSEASGETSHAEGSSTIASGANSHAEGSSTIASGHASHSEGFLTVAAGAGSHAEGFAATAGHDWTYIWSDGNLGTITQNISTTKTGQYMVSASGGVFIPGKVGIGTDSVANALTVVGNISASGYVYGQNNTRTYKFLSGGETSLDAGLHDVFFAIVSGSRVFNFVNFAIGSTVDLYLSANHTLGYRHYFPTNTFVHPGSGNTAWTYNSYVTKITFQNINGQYIGESVTIQTNVPPITSTAHMMLDGITGFLLQENENYLILD